jgi:hypothetical protein
MGQLDALNPPILVHWHGGEWGNWGKSGKFEKNFAQGVIDWRSGG